MGSKWDIEKFTISNDFGLWKVNMEAVLIQQKCAQDLKDEGVLPVTMSQAEKTEMVDKARSAIVLCLGDKVLRDIPKEPTVASMWYLAHRQFLKQQLYSFKMVESKTVMKQLTEFNKILVDLENIEVHLEDEDKTLLLLCALLRSFESFKDTILYGKEGTVTN